MLCLKTWLGLGAKNTWLGLGKNEMNPFVGELVQVVSNGGLLIKALFG